MSNDSEIIVRFACSEEEYALYKSHYNKMSESYKKENNFSQFVKNTFQSTVENNNK